MPKIKPSKVDPIKRPIKSLADFRRKPSTWYVSDSVTKFFDENPTKWPCMTCNGAGQIDDESERGMPYGRANYVKCPVCKGTRCGPKELVAVKYREIMDTYLKRKRDLAAGIKARKSGLQKLTEEEIRAISWLGL